MKKKIAIEKKEIGCEVPILDHKSYIEKCLDVFNRKQLHKLQKDLTKALERKMQRTPRKIKCHLDEIEQKKLYPTGSPPGLFLVQLKYTNYKQGKI